jgi:acetyl esterase/lipase
MPVQTLPAGVRVLPDVIYARTAARPLVLDLYLHENAGQPQPLIVFVHGGAFRAGSKKDCAEALKLISSGFAIASIGYRLSQEALFPAQIRDIKAAVRWLRAHAGEHNLDPNRFGAMGPSAGGHLVAMLGLSARVREWDDAGDHIESADSSISSAVQAVVDWFGPTDFLRMNDQPGGMDHDAPDSPESQLIGAPIQQNPQLVARANPITYATPAAPPFLICHGDHDPLVLYTQSVMLHQALQKAGSQATLVLVPGAGHGFQGKQYRDMVEKAREFFNRHLRG